MKVSTAPISCVPAGVGEEARVEGERDVHEVVRAVERVLERVRPLRVAWNYLRSRNVVTVTRKVLCHCEPQKETNQCKAA